MWIVFTAETDAFRFCAAVDRALGYPAADALAAPVGTGPWGPPVPNETHALPERLADGTTAVYVAQLPPEILGRSVTVDGQAIRVAKTGAVASLPSARTMTPLPPRGGIAGASVAVAKGQDV